MESGILLIDKPAGMTSARGVAIVKRLTGAGKVGHTGTLDPMATGLLICCLNQATKLAQFLLKGEKTYEAVLHLGVQTDTQDATGRVTARKSASQVMESDVAEAMQAFTGNILQQPPAYSALKHQGKPLYHWARSGKPVVKPPRNVVISELVIKKIVWPEVFFRITCSAGTYVRTVCADVGDALGCGGHLSALRRTASCGFSIPRAVTPAQLEDAVQAGSWKKRLISPADALADIPAHPATDALGEKIKFGRPIGPADGIQVQSKNVKIIDADGKLLAIIDETYRYCCVFPNGI